MKPLAFFPIVLVLISVGCELARPSEVSFIENQIRDKSATPDSVKITKWEHLGDGKYVRTYYVEVKEKNLYNADITNRLVFSTRFEDGGKGFRIVYSAEPLLSRNDPRWPKAVDVEIRRGDKMEEFNIQASGIRSKSGDNPS